MTDQAFGVVMNVKRITCVSNFHQWKGEGENTEMDLWNFRREKGTNRQRGLTVQNVPTGKRG